MSSPSPKRKTKNMYVKKKRHSKKKVIITTHVKEKKPRKIVNIYEFFKRLDNRCKCDQFLIDENGHLVCPFCRGV